MTGQKSDFSNIYVQPDPRAYYGTLARLDYEIPSHGTRVFGAILDTLPAEADGRAPTVLDVCCSYGVNAALFNHDLSFGEIHQHYTHLEDDDPDAVIAADRELFASRRRPDAVDFVGLDASEPAISYGLEAGLLADGVAADLEGGRLTDDQAARLEGVDLVTITGGVGYVGARTFDQVLDAVDEPPCVAALSLRWIDFAPITDVLDAHDLVVEHVDEFVVPQRRFTGAAERRFVMDQLDAMDRPATSVERGGRHAADLYVARPARMAEEHPIGDIVDALTDD